MKISNIHISGVGGLGSIDILFNNRMNIICGPNGIGKTTVLESIAHLFAWGQTSILKRNVKFESSQIKGTFTIDEKDVSSEVAFKNFIPEKSNDINSPLHSYSKYLISLKTSRTFDYVPLRAVEKDTNKDDGNLWTDSKQGIQLTNIKNWFVNRYLYYVHEGALTKEQKANFDLAKSVFSLLNPNFQFSKVEASSNEIMVETPTGLIYYEYLSSGFKSILSVAFGIIKEIEFRFVEPRIEAKSFDGIILIDELELHLHPEWQERVTQILLDLFPNAQFITTTHSPHVIQFAESNQVVALSFFDNNVVRRDLVNSKYGYQGWTVEEILRDVMDMEDTQTKVFNENIQEFEKAIDNNDYKKSIEIYSKLEEMLHPQNSLKKLLKFQIASIKTEPND
ncbi:AAA family ATPase [Pedobacter sp. HMF7647]|uniref:AAA family ATPase n=1 Tax=Hufsiella arboris TaxID=2695275 RepID=A0A7K1YGY2_9SPHI|nr:AAA family ATPase [Hufsiella arboris]MXV53319.1 AAA family ATPase [Hufsiella arboris]